MAKIEIKEKRLRNYLTDAYGDNRRTSILPCLTVISKSSGPDLTVGVRLCKQDELADILALQMMVDGSITNKELFVCSAEEALNEALKTDICIGVYLNNCLIAFTLMIINPDSPENLGYHLKYSREQCMKCVTYDTTFVHPDYKGYSIQRLLISLKDSIAVELGACEALATVSPDNMVSLNNLKASGFEIAEEKQLYGTLNRYIMRKYLLKKIEDQEGGNNAAIPSPRNKLKQD
jgi:hypothetical protein